MYTFDTLVIIFSFSQEYEARLEAMLKLASELEVANYHDKGQIKERCVSDVVVIFACSRKLFSKVLQWYNIYPSGYKVWVQNSF